MKQSNPHNYVASEHEYFDRIAEHAASSSGSYSEKAHAFPRFVPRQSISYFLARAKVFEAIVGLHGAVLDFGVHRGSSLFAWAQLSAILEPYNHNRRIVGFDSFEGFSEVESVDESEQDRELALKRAGGMAIEEGARELRQAADIYDLNRPLGHVGRVEIVDGELPGAAQRYLSDHPETMVALANFGLGLYSPTTGILESIRDRLQVGSVLVFEELNQQMWPGETLALRKLFAPSEISLERFPYVPQLSFMRVRG